MFFAFVMTPTDNISIFDGLNKIKFLSGKKAVRGIFPQTTLREIN
jgi:hypothetical protein